jgi:hypothetical protein
VRLSPGTLGGVSGRKSMSAGSPVSLLGIGRRASGGNRPEGSGSYSSLAGAHAASIGKL